MGSQLGRRMGIATLNPSYELQLNEHLKWEAL